MRSNPLIRSLEPADWVLIGYLLGLVVWYLYDVGTDVEDTPRSWSDQSVTLNEDHLQRLEDGDSVKVRRWHGHELVLDGGMVIDAEQGDTGD